MKKESFELFGDYSSYSEYQTTKAPTYEVHFVSKKGQYCSQIAKTVMSSQFFNKKSRVAIVHRNKQYSWFPETNSEFLTKIKAELNDEKIKIKTIWSQ